AFRTLFLLRTDRRRSREIAPEREQAARRCGRYSMRKPGEKSQVLEVERYRPSESRLHCERVVHVVDRVRDFHISRTFVVFGIEPGRGGALLVRIGKPFSNFVSQP